MLQETARGRDYDVGTFAECFSLLYEGLTSNDESGSDMDGSTEGLHLVVDLNGQLARWGQHHSKDPIRVGRESLENGKSEHSRFTRTRFGNTRHILPSQYFWNTILLATKRNVVKRTCTGVGRVICMELTHFTTHSFRPRSAKVRRSSTLLTFKFLGSTFSPVCSFAVLVFSMRAFFENMLNPSWSLSLLSIFEKCSKNYIILEMSQEDDGHEKSSRYKIVRELGGGGGGKVYLVVRYWLFLVNAIE